MYGVLVDVLTSLLRTHLWKKGLLMMFDGWTGDWVTGGVREVETPHFVCGSW